MNTTGFRRIREHYLHGWEAGERFKGRHVEVVRCYTCQWSVFASENGRPVRGEQSRTEDRPVDCASADAAMRWARAYLAGAIHPETWPR